MIDPYATSYRPGSGLRQPIRVYLKIMKNMIKKQHTAAVAVLLSTALLSATLCTSCGLHPTEDDPATSDTVQTEDVSAETTSADPEQATQKIPTDGNASEPVTEDVSHEAATGESAETTDSQASNETQVPSQEETSVGNEAGGEDPAETSENPSEADSEEPSADMTQEPSDELTKEPTVDTPEETVPEDTTPPYKPTYEEYCAMTSQEQVAFFNSFSDVEDYFLWFEWAKADYEERNPGIEIGPDGIIIP